MLVQAILTDIQVVAVEVLQFTTLLQVELAIKEVMVVILKENHHHLMVVEVVVVLERMV